MFVLGQARLKGAVQMVINTVPLVVSPIFCAIATGGMHS